MIDENCISDIQNEASLLLDELNISELPINPFEIANKLDIALRPMPDNVKSASGMLMNFQSEFLIGYPTRIQNEGYIRFSVGHELGHYRLPGHASAVINENGQHFSRAGFVTNDSYELEADYFSASLLMPEDQFTKALLKMPNGLIGIDRLRKLCITSLEATAIRYTRFAQYPVVVIRSNGRNVDYSFMSRSFRALPNIRWLKKYSCIPINSTSYTFVNDSKKINKSGRTVGTSDIREWFLGESFDLVEEVVKLGRSGKILTVMYPK